MQSVLSFLGRAFRPLNGWLGNVIGLVLSFGVIAALAKTHALWAVIGGLIIVIALVTVAGVRLQRQCNSVLPSAAQPLPDIKRPTTEQVNEWRAAKEKQDRGEKLRRKDRRALNIPGVGITRGGYVEYLGRMLQLGGWSADSLESEAWIFQREWDDFKKTRPDHDVALAWLEAWPSKAVDEVRDWARKVREALNERLDSTYASRFGNNAGLIPRTPPATLTDPRYIQTWQDHDMRMQRLHQIIEELTRKWDL